MSQSRQTRRTALNLAAAVVALAMSGCEPGEAARYGTTIGTTGRQTSDMAGWTCSVGLAARLDDRLRETSGIARGRSNDAILWTHNDSGNAPVIFAVDLSGRLVGSVPIAGVEIIDMEDIDAGPCSHGNCLFLADTGDNDGTRGSISIHIVVEPSPDADEIRPIETVQAVYPGGPRDAEAIFVLPDGGLFLVTKGREGAIELYRVPRAKRLADGPQAIVTLERIRTLFPPPSRDDRVTAASAMADGRWVALRTYRSLHLYPASDLVSGRAVTPSTIDLRLLGESQGEAVAIDTDGVVWLTSEAERGSAAPIFSRLDCTLPPGPS